MKGFLRKQELFFCAIFVGNAIIHRFANFFEKKVVPILTWGGLRPGEKLYEELLVRTDELDTTENDLIFVEKEKPISYDEVEQKLSVLKNAVNSNNNDLAREALRFVIPTFKSPEEVNKNAEESIEMNIVKKI